MDQASETRLKYILGLEPHELTEEHKAFLRARSAYVGRSSREKFKEVFKEVPVVKEVQEDKEPSTPEDPFTQAAEVTQEENKEIIV